MKTFFEGIADITLFILVTLPAVVFLATSKICQGWNEGTMSGSCAIPALEGAYNGINALGLIFSFGGFIIWLPIVIIVLLISVGIKIYSLVRGYRWNTVRNILQLVFLLVNLVILFLLIKLFFFPDGIWILFAMI